MVITDFRDRSKTLRPTLYLSSHWQEPSHIVCTSFHSSKIFMLPAAIMIFSHAIPSNWNTLLSFSSFSSRIFIWYYFPQWIYHRSYTTLKSRTFPSHRITFLSFTEKDITIRSGTSLVIQWLTLHAFNAGGPGSIPGQGTNNCILQPKILHVGTKGSCMP